MPKLRFMVVEDDPIIAADVENRLKGLDYTVAFVTASGEEAVNSAKETCCGLVLMDIKLKGNIDGIDAAEQILQRFNIPVVFVTAYADKETLQKAKLTKPFGFILKPFSDRELRAAIETVLYMHKMETKLGSLNILGQQIGFSLSLEVVVQTAVSLIMENPAQDFGAFFLKNDEQLVPKAYSARDPQYNNEGILVHLVGECLCGLSVSHGKPIYSSDIHTDQDVHGRNIKR